MRFSSEAKKSIAARHVKSVFGISSMPELTIADGLEISAVPGTVILFTGASGSGKSVMMRECAKQLGSVASVDDIRLDAISTVTRN